MYTTGQVSRMLKLWPWDWFDDEWFFTRQAARLFIISTFFVLALTPVFLGGINPQEVSTAGRVLWGVVGISGSISLFFLWIGMWRFWVQADNSTVAARKVWFIILLAGVWWASCLYCYLVYWPQVRKKWVGESQ